MKISEIQSRTSVPEVQGEIVSIGEARQFANERGSGRVCDAALKDKTGEIKLSLWNEQIDQVKEGSTVKIENGWCSEWQGQKQLSTGKFGKLTVVK
ncbi:MAG: DNA-binding protein [Candidatus Diapherotrites archaeon]|nr:DNA-binding protein [Candidatus Diapherotrites archaeon]